MALVRYRKLTHKFDAQGYRSEIRAAGQRAQDDVLPWAKWNWRARRDARTMGEAAATVEGLFETPLLVEAEDGQADESAVRELLRRGELMPTDLVDAGSGWTTLAESPAFFELCEQLAAERAAKRRLLIVGGAGAALALLATVWILMR